MAMVCSEAHCCGYPGWKGGLIGLHSWKQNETQQWETLPVLSLVFFWQKILEDFNLCKKRGYSRKDAIVGCF